MYFCELLEVLEVLLADGLPFVGVEVKLVVGLVDEVVGAHDCLLQHRELLAELELFDVRQWPRRRRRASNH